MKTEETITKQIADIQADYHQRAAKLTTTEVAKVNEKLKVLRQDLSDLLSEGAKACPKDKVKPLGMRRGVITHGKVQIPLYEVGCLLCERAVQAASPKEAVAQWNESVKE